MRLTPARFAEEHGVTVGASEASVVGSSLSEAREAIRTLLTDRADADLAPVRALLQAARVGVDDHGLTLHADPACRTLAVRAVHDAVELLHRKGPRIRSCAHPTCVLWFLDTTRSGTRRWCSMATCGNRSKARRFSDARKGH